MELVNFYKLLLRYKLLLIGIPVFTVIITYVLVRKLPDRYISMARIATNIVNKPDELIRSNPYVQETKVTQDFSNLIEQALMKKMINQVSYSLLLHDLSEKKSFRPLSKIWLQTKSYEKSYIQSLLAQKFALKEELQVMNPLERKIDSLLVSMKYDEQSIREKLSVQRLSNSDFLDMRFEAENPLITAFVLQTLTKEFIAFHTENLSINKNNAITYLESLMNKKEAEIRQKTQELKLYKIKNGVLDVNNQASTIISQIAEFESKRQEAQKNISAYSGALKNIEAKFDPNDRKYLESSTTNLNQEIASTRARLSSLNDAYIKSNFDNSYKNKIDSLQNHLANKINQTNDLAVNSPLASKKELVQEKMNMEVSLDMAKNSVSSLDNEVTKLNSRLYALVPDQAAIKALQDELDIRTREYIDLSEKYNQAVLESNFASKLQLVEAPLPGEKQPSKKLLLVGLSGVISFVLSTMVLFLLFYFDHSIKDAAQLANATGLPVIGSLNLLSTNILPLREMWHKSLENGEWAAFKNQLRSIRFELENVAESSKVRNAEVIAVSSLHGGEGKTFFSLNLAYAFAKINKRVLLIDGNFNEPAITEITSPDFYLEDYLTADGSAFLFEPADQKLVILGNEGGDTSLWELGGKDVSFKARFDALRSRFDFIIIEIPSINTHNKAKEWIRFSDKVIAVFAASQTIKAADKEYLDYLKNLESKTTAWVLNKVKPQNTSGIVKQNRKRKTDKRIAA